MRAASPLLEGPDLRLGGLPFGGVESSQPLPHDLLPVTPRIRFRVRRAQLVAVLAVPMILIAIGAIAAQTLPRSLDQLRAEYGTLIAKLPTGDEFQTWSDPDSQATLRQVRKILEDWTVSYLNLRPDASAETLAQDIVSLNPDPLPALPLGFEHYTLRANALQLVAGQGAVYAVAVNFGRRGSVFVVERRGGFFHRVWDIREQAAKEASHCGPLAYWTVEAFAYSGGCLTGVVYLLPKSAAGRPRFAVDATPNPEAGNEQTKQVSIWEWDGHRPRALLIRDYEVSFQGEGEAPPISVEGPWIEMQTKGVSQVLSMTADDARPVVRRRILVGPTTVRELAPEFDEPECKVVDDVLWCMLHGHCPSSLTSKTVVRTLRRNLEPELLRVLQRNPAACDTEKEGWRCGAMVASWNVYASRQSAKVTEVAVTLDLGAFKEEASSWRVTIEQRGRRPFVSRVEIPRPTFSRTNEAR